MTTAVDLLLLGLLIDRPMHGYEIDQKIKAEGIDLWFNISMPSIYYSLNKLKEKGFITETRQRGAGASGRSVYHLTEEGRAAFFKAMEEQVAGERKITFEYDLSIYLLNKLPLERALTLLERRKSYLENWRSTIQEKIKEWHDEGRSPLELAILDHASAFAQMEINWLMEFIRGIQGEEPATGEERESKDLMVLAGDLHNFHLPDLIHLIASGQHSGTLTLRNGSAVRTLTFEHGHPVCASSHCLAGGGKSGGEEGVSQDSLVREPSQVFDDICDCFRWQEGTFTFDQKVGCKAWCVPLRLSVESLILEGSRWVDNWAIIQRLVPSANVVFERTSQTRLLDKLALTPCEKQILETVDGLKDVATIAAQTGLTLFETSRSLYCLSAVGLLQMADLDKIRLRRLFRELSELLCRSTVAWRSAPDDYACEEEVNRFNKHLPFHINQGRIEDQADPWIKTTDLVRMYKDFLKGQLKVIGQRFGTSRAKLAFRQVLQQLAPELQEMARRYNFIALLDS